MTAHLKILKWLIDNPGWHTAEDVVEGMGIELAEAVSGCEELVNCDFADQLDEMPPNPVRLYKACSQNSEAVQP